MSNYRVSYVKVEGKKRCLFRNPFAHPCHALLSYDRFYPSPRRQDGLSSYCKDCMKKDAKERYQKNKKMLDNT